MAATKTVINEIEELFKTRNYAPANTEALFSFQEIQLRDLQECIFNLEGIFNKNKHENRVSSSKPEWLLYAKAYEDLTKESYWENLFQENTIKEHNKKRILALKKYFLSAPHPYDLMQPISFILDYIKDLKKMKKLIHKNTAMIRADYPDQHVPQAIEDKLYALNEVIFNEIKRNADALLWKIRPALTTHNLKYINDPLPFVLDELDSCNIKNHNLPRLTRTTHSVSNKEYTTILNTVTKYTNGRYFISLSELTHSAKLTAIELVYLSHEDARYSLLCPVEFTNDIVLKPPVFPSLWQGEYLRYHFFRENAINFMNINSLSQEVSNQIKHNRVFNCNDESYIKLMNTINGITTVVNEHEKDIKVKFIDTNSVFNKIFRQKTLAFQSRWKTKFTAIRGDMATKRIDALKTLVQASYMKRLSQFVLGEDMSLNVTTLSEGWIDSALDKSKFTHLTDAQEMARAKVERECKELISIPLELIKKKKGPTTLAQTIKAYIGNNELDKVFNLLKFIVDAKLVTSTEIPAKILHDTYNFLNKNMADLFVRFENDPHNLRLIGNIVSAFDQLLVTEDGSSLPSLVTKWDEFFEEKKSIPSAHTRKNQGVNRYFVEYEYKLMNVIQKVMAAIDEYEQRGVWRWPLDANDVEEIKKRNDATFKAILTKKVEEQGTLQLVDLANQLATQASDENVNKDLQAITYLLQGKFSLFSQSLPKEIVFQFSEQNARDIVLQEANKNKSPH